MTVTARLFLLAAVLAALPACQDAAGVGLGLVDGGDADPSVETLTATSVDTFLAVRPLIGFADSTAALSQTRVLVGDVMDPVFGDARAVGYLDFTRPAVGDTVEAGDVRSVRLELARDYVYGDTTTTLPLALREVRGRWSVTTDYAADTTFDVGPVLAEASVSVADSGVVVFELPASWVAANAEAFLSTDFNEAFEGFAVEPTARPAPGAVFGFQTQSARTRLRVETVDDTLSYPVGEVFTSVQRAPSAAVPARFVPAQVGAGRGVRLQFPLGELGPVPLARAVFRAPVETSLARDGAFVRPVARRAALFGVTPDGARVLVGLVTVADGEATTQTLDLDVVQRAVLGETEFTSFELLPGAGIGAGGAVPAPASLDVLPVVRLGGAEAPRFTFTVAGRS